MTTATVCRKYTVDLDSPLWPREMTHKQRLTAWVEMAKMYPDEAFKYLEQDDVTGSVNSLCEWCRSDKPLFWAVYLAAVMVITWTVLQ